MQFDERAVKRIAKAVHGFERSPRNKSQFIPASRGGVSGGGFWAKIKGGNGSTGSGGVQATDRKYSWVAVAHKSDFTLEEKSDWGQGAYTDTEGFAVEARYGSKYVLRDEIVWMTPAKTEDSISYYTFDYNPHPRFFVTGSGVIYAGSWSGNTFTPGYGTGFIEYRYTDSNNTMTLQGDYLNIYNPFTSQISNIGNLSTKKWIAEYGTGGLWWCTGLEC